RISLTALRFTPFSERCSFPCRRVSANVPPNSHVPAFTRLGLAIRFAHKSPVSTGALAPASFAIFRAYVSVTLSARPCALTPAREKSFMTSFNPCTLTLKFTLTHVPSIHIDYARRFPFEHTKESQIPYRYDSSALSCSLCP